MIIFGWRGRSSIEQTGLFDCPVCKAKTQFVVSRSRPWFTLFFIPIFPVGQGIRAKICASCGTILDPNYNSQPPVFSSSQAGGPQPVALQSGNPAAAQQRFSALAIVSLIAGFISPPFIIACFLSLITSTVAIVTGHIALYKIKRSNKQLEGRAVAIVGVVLGYISMALTIGLIVFIFTRPASTTRGSSTVATGVNSAQSRLDEAELSVLAGSKETIGRGNTEFAASLATKFAEDMKRADEMAFTSNRKPGFQMSGGEYRTYCELHEDSCAFIVHVPSYRNFTDDAEKALNSLVWLTALATVKDHLNEGDSLAVGLRGTFKYGEILVGKVSNSDDLDLYKGSTRDLVRFFERNDTQPETTPSTESAIFPPVVSTEPSEPSPFDSPVLQSPPPEPSLASNEPTVSNAMPTEDRATTAPPVDALADTGRSNAAPVEKTEPRPRPKPKPKPPEFENKLPVSLIKSIEARGWNIKSMIFDRSGSRLIAGALDDTISVFDIQSGEILFRSGRQEDLSQVVALALSKDGKTLFAGGMSGRVASYEIMEDGSLSLIRLLYKHNREAKCLIVSPSFPFVLSGGYDGTVVWQPYDERFNSLKLVQELKRNVLAAHLFKDRNEGLATDGQSLIRFSVKDSKVLDTQKIGKSYARVAAFSPDGSRCAVASGNDLKLVETTGATIEQSYASTETIWSVLFHPTQPWIITGGRGTATIWDREPGERLAVLDAESIQYIMNLAITADGKTLALVPSSASQPIKVFDLTK